MTRIETLDSTLRDGVQGARISYSVADKLKIVGLLDRLGVDLIEAGNPGSNPKDKAFFEAVQGIELKHASICAFGPTVRKGTAPSRDEGLKTLLDTGVGTAVIFGKAWMLHVDEVLRITAAQNLAIISDTIKYIKDSGLRVIFDAEHFFSGAADSMDYALEALGAAYHAGADTLCLCDTNGGAHPVSLREATLKATAAFPGAVIGIHCHDDGGCAVANSMLAVDAGARHIQGTLLGIGERCGNANLSTLIAGLTLKENCECVSGPLSELSAIARSMAEITNMAVPGNTPYIGTDAFSHKAGMHADGAIKLPRTFEHVEPASVGNVRKLPLSEVSGRAAVYQRLLDIMPDLEKDAPVVATVLRQIKKLEMAGYQFEAADASFRLLAMRELGLYKPFFSLVSYKTISESHPAEGELPASAIIRLKVGHVAETTAAVGEGPVHALDLALRKALRRFYPMLDDMRLIDYKVRVLDGSEAAAAHVRVLIESGDSNGTWTTVGVSNDIIKASWRALCDSVDFMLMRTGAHAADS